LVLTDNTGNATDRYQPGIVSDTQLVFSNPFKEIGYYHIYLNAAHGRSEITRVNIVLGYPSVSKNALQIRKVYTRTNGKELIIEGDNIADAWLLYGGNSYYPGVRTNTQLIFTNPLSDGYQTVQLNSAYGRSQEFNILISNKEVKPLVVHIQDFPSSEINLGDTINLTADMGGGTGQYRVVWSLNNPGVHKFGFESNSYKTDTTHNIPNITLQKLGTYSISATVTDTNGNTATDVKSIKVTDSSSVNNTGAIANALQGVLDRLRQLLAEPITP